MGVYRKGKNWYIDYYYKGRRIRKKIGPSKQVAELTLKDVEVKIAKGEYLGIYEEKKIRFSDYAEEYLEYSRANKAANSYRRDVTSVRSHLIPCFGGRYLPNITAKMGQDYVSKRAQEANVATVNRELCCLKNMLRKAVEWGYIKQNPAAGIKQFKETPKAARYLTSEECSALLAACPDHLYPIVVLALNTGMRKGELLHLQWEDVDFRRGTITVRNRRDFHTKNYEDRVIPMNDEVREVLRKLPRHIRSPYVFPSIADPEGNAYNDVKRSFTSAVKRSRIEHVRFHDLRHTFASHLVMAGVDIRTVQTLLGHKDISTTMRYAHLAPDHLKGAVERLDFSDGHHMDTRAN